ncbi:unnamed protein product [Echinostoma caproni]|uniref:Uncharacterized protein n=1 Tax=Echinostoma caproni TaxID=27848 RepID=A0A183A3H9_9TREM|nr:unnamed protein product [Echinostoma caproni]
MTTSSLEEPHTCTANIDSLAVEDPKSPPVDGVAIVLLAPNSPVVVIPDVLKLLPNKPPVVLVVVALIAGEEVTDVAVTLVDVAVNVDAVEVVAVPKRLLVPKRPSDPEFPAPWVDKKLNNPPVDN